MNFPQETLNALRSARSLTVLTGAGVSAESGVPTFRGASGFWKNFRAEDIATLDAFERNPKFVWEWYDARRQQLATLNPNTAHIALAQFESRIENFSLITQNVDGLHQKGGSTNVIEFHGNICVLGAPLNIPRAKTIRSPLIRSPLTVSAAPS